MKFRDESDLPESGGQNFIKLKDGETVSGVFVGDPYEFYVIWEENKSKVVPNKLAGSKFRFRLNMVIKDKSGSYVAKIFEQGPTVYRRLIELNKTFDGLENIVLKITRRGSTLNDTEYHVDPLMDPQNPRQLMQIPVVAKHVKPLDLSHDAKDREINQQIDDAGPWNGEVPF